MTGKEFFTVTNIYEGRSPELEVSKAAKQINPDSILMVRGLPTLQRDESKLADGRARLDENGSFGWLPPCYDDHTGEYARLNKNGQFDRKTGVWVEDPDLHPWFARFAAWRYLPGRVSSNVTYNFRRDEDFLGSRGVLRVNLNLED